jgi:hypothetical protein
VKKFVFAALSLSMCLSTAAFAKDTTVSSGACIVRQTGEVVEGKRFFSDAYNKSSSNRCVIAKIYGEAETSRVYVDRRREGDKNSGMSNSEVDSTLYSIGLNSGDCEVYSCVEANYVSLWNF